MQIPGYVIVFVLADFVVCGDPFGSFTLSSTQSKDFVESLLIVMYRRNAGYLSLPLSCRFRFTERPAQPRGAADIIWS